MDEALLNSRIDDYCTAITSGARNTGGTYPEAVRKNQRWQRIISVSGPQRFCHTWIDRTNGMVTYGGWAAPTRMRATKSLPARYAYRYNLLDDASFATLMVRVFTERNFWLYQDDITQACI